MKGSALAKLLVSDYLSGGACAAAARSRITTFCKASKETSAEAKENSMVTLLIILAVLAGVWRLGYWPFDRSYAYLPKYGEHRGANKS